MKIKTHLIWLATVLIAVFLSHLFKGFSGRDLDVETAHELRRAIQSYEDEFESMDSMTSTEIMQSLTGNNPKNLMFYDSKRETNLRLVDGEFVCRSGKRMVVFFSRNELLIAIVSHGDGGSVTPDPAPSTHTIKCVLANRTKRA